MCYCYTLLCLTFSIVVITVSEWHCVQNFYRGFKNKVISWFQDSVETPSTHISLESYGHEDFNDMLSLPLNWTVSDLYAIEFSPFGEDFGENLCTHNHDMYTVWKVIEKYFGHFCKVDHTQKMCCRLWHRSLVSSPLRKISYVSSLALLLRSLNLPLRAKSDMFPWRETGYKFTARKRVFFSLC